MWWTSITLVICPASVLPSFMIALIPSYSWGGLASFLAPGWSHGPGLSDECAPSRGHRGPACRTPGWDGASHTHTGWPLPPGSRARPVNIRCHLRRSCPAQHVGKTWLQASPTPERAPWLCRLPVSYWGGAAGPVCKHGGELRKRCVSDDHRQLLHLPETSPSDIGWPGVA